jgi:cytoskeletal protein RodZ
MINQSSDNRIRPLFAVVLCFVVAGLVALLWMIRPAAPKVAITAPPTEVDQVPATVVPEVVPPVPRKRVYKQAKARKADVAAAPQTLEDQWGIQVSSLRLSMANSVVDLRYKVINPDKAILLGNGKTTAYIIDHATGKKLIMPSPPKEGAFPPTSNKLVGGKTYFSMVSNQGRALKSGSQVTVIVGNSQATNLTVE